MLKPIFPFEVPTLDLEHCTVKQKAVSFPHLPPPIHTYTFTPLNQHMLFPPGLQNTSKNLLSLLLFHFYFYILFISTHLSLGLLLQGKGHVPATASLCQSSPLCECPCTTHDSSQWASAKKTNEKQQTFWVNVSHSAAAPLWIDV